MWLKVMLRHLRTTLPTFEAPACVPEGLRVYAIADIHGRADLLREMLKMIAADTAGAPAEVRLIYLGDYVDRGPSSRDVIDLLVAAQSSSEHSIFLEGNHEHALMSFLADPEKGAAWLDFGGLATLASYGVRVPHDLSGRQRLMTMRDQFENALPPEHLAFFHTLRLSEMVGDYLFVHAGIRPCLPLDQQTPLDLMTIRDPFLDWEQPLDKVVVHGHSISLEPVFRRWRIGIDAGAYATGHLLCLVLEGDRQRILST